MIERFVYEACEDAYKQENVHVLELRYAPTFIQAMNTHLKIEDIHKAVVQGAERARKDFNISVGILGTLQRILPIKESERVMDFFIDHRDSIVGVDLADNEEGFEPKPFAPLFMKAKKAGLGVTIHAGEINTPESPQYVVDAINYLGAARIGHGIQIYKDPKAVACVKANDVTLEVALTSNRITNAVVSFESHPVKALLEQGVSMTLCTDDPLAFGTDLNREYDRLVKYHGFNEENFQACNRMGWKSSFIKDKNQI